MTAPMYVKGNLIVAGKTKEIFAVNGNPDLVWVRNKDDITAFDNPNFTKQFATKATSATTTTCRVFELLRQAGIPVAYERQLSPTEFLAHACRMIPIEAVARRYAFGSYLTRFPNRVVPGNRPLRFHRLVTELFLKTTRGGLKSSSGQVLVEGLDPLKGEEDPFIPHPQASEWVLCHAKKPSWDKASDLHRKVDRKTALLDCGTDEVARGMVEEMEKWLRQVFLVLEGAWASLDHRLIDLKIEFGLDTGGRLCVADVIDNDSWRLRDANWQEFSKEAFRQGEALEAVEHKYASVAALVGQFRSRTQALVTWRGSESDPPVLAEAERERLKKIGIETPSIVLSAHKATARALQLLEETLSAYPAGGVIVAKVGRSNGLGPTVAAHTTWPVITIPASLKEFPDDIWSSVRMPSDVPLLTAWPDQNAIDAALNILARGNPILYMQQQYKLEERDT
jgi:phosphoribosylaminoimidazole carboxylase / phosphoribosylaminoimidazole-succinocarboxamide synthase